MCVLVLVPLCLGILIGSMVNAGAPPPAATASVLPAGGAAATAPLQLPPPAVMSRSLRDGAVAPIEAVFIDFDGTLLNNNVFSEALLAQCQTLCSCDCTATTGPGSLAGLVSSLPLSNITSAFGGAARLQPGARLAAQSVRVVRFNPKV